MIHNTKKDFLKNIPENSKLAALDVGTKTIGIAVCDETKTITTPKYTIQRKGNKKDIPILLEKLKEYNVSGIVVGLPLSAENQDTEMSLFIKRFAENLEKQTQLLITFQNERLTSHEAKSFMIDQMKVKYSKTQKVIDQIAAACILESFLIY